MDKLLNINKQTWIFGIALGFFTCIAQVSIMREAMLVYGGNELALGIGFFGWLAGVAAGSALANRLSKKIGSLLLVSFSAWFVVFLAMLVLRFHRLILNVHQGQVPGFFPSLCLLSAASLAGGLTAGFLFITILRYKRAVSEKTPASNLFIFESFGALCGGVFYTYLFSGRLCSFDSLAASACVLVFSLVFTRDSKIRKYSATFIGLAILATIFSGILKKMDDKTIELSFKHLSTSDELVAYADSKYGRVLLGKAGDEYHMYKDMKFESSFPDPWSRSPVVHMAMNQHPSPREILIIGGGPSDRIDVALKYNPSSIIMTYLDIKEFEMQRPFLPQSVKKALADPRVVSVEEDGINYIKKSHKKFDVVIVAVNPPVTAGSMRYHIREFFMSLKNVLAPGGIVAVTANGTANLMSPETSSSTASQIATIRSVFPDIQIVPGLDIIILAGIKPDSLTDNPQITADRYVARGINSPFFSKQRFFYLLNRKRIDDVKRQTGKVQARINTIESPFVYLANIQLWERITSENPAENNKLLLKLAQKHVYWTVIIFLAIFILWKRRLLYSRPGFSAHNFSMYTTGASGMSIFFITIYVFQCHAGSVYSGLGMFTGIFMLGLGTGSIIGKRLIEKVNNKYMTCASDIFVILILTFISLFIGMTRMHENLTYLVSISGGIACGFSFPVLLGRMTLLTAKNEKVYAASMETSDHMGAAAGVLLTSCLFLPTLGIKKTCIIFIALKILSLSWLVILNFSGNMKYKGFYEKF